MKIQEDFIPYELALLAEKKGFKEQCFGWHNYKTIEIFGQDIQLDMYAGDENRPLAPTYQQIIEWLMDKYKIYISIEPFAKFGKQEWQYNLYRLKINFWGDKEGYNPVIKTNAHLFNSYKEALNFAIEEALNLI